MKKYLYLLSALFLGFLITACGDQKSQETASDQAQTTIRIGMPPSAHNILIEEVVKPQLEKEGYTVELLNFSTLRNANSALIEGAIDFHIAQHQAYLDVYNQETGANLISLVHTPSIGAFLYSIQQNSLDAVTDGETVLIPNDPSNAARSYALLAKIGWITVNPDVNVATLTQADITGNPHNLKFKEVDSALIPRLLEEFNYGIMPGGVALLAGMSSDQALAEEDMLENLELMATVRPGDENKPWAQAVIKAYQSDELRHYINTDPEVKGWFIWPRGTAQ